MNILVLQLTFVQLVKFPIVILRFLLIKSVMHFTIKQYMSSSKHCDCLCDDWGWGRRE